MSDILLTSDVIKEAQQNGYTGIIIPEEYDQTAVPFRPVKCTEAALQVTEPVEGYVYFTTDTKKIYYGHDGKFLGMGGNSGFYYGNKTIQDTELDYIVITVDELDGDVLPNVDDLIINVGGNQYDGFYRVVEQVSDYEVHVVQLPVGGGGGGGGSGSTSGRVTVRRITPGQQTIIAGRELTIEYSVDAVDINGEPVVVPGRAIWRVNNVVVAQESNVLPGTRSFKISDYLDLTKETNTVGLVVLMDTGGSYDSQGTASWSVSVINLNFEWNYDYANNPYIRGQNFTLSWIVRGIPRNMQAGEQVLTHILFDNNYVENNGYYTQPVTRDQQGVPIQRTFQSLPYGVHDVEMWVTATVGGLPIETDHQKNKLIFTDGGSSVLIAIPFFQEEATRYDTLQIPFLIYQPGQVTVQAEWLVNGQVVSSGSYDESLHYWIHTLSQDGEVTLTIRSGSVSASVVLNVAPLDLPVVEPMDYKFALKPKLLDGNEALRNWSEGDVNLTFSDNFDWDNGGIKNIDGTTCIVIKHNTTMTINYALFSGRAENNGKLLKFVFKASNCYDYAAPVLTCYDEANNVGLRVTAQQAILSGTTTTVSTNYYEDTYIELEADIWKTDSSDFGERYVMLWVDGIPTAVRVYPSGSSNNFTQNTPQYITIGSPDCDVYVYLVKEYERTLTKEEHLNNFIVDAPTTEELIERYNRNDILDTTGEISPYRLAERNPNCQVHLYDISRMTTSKSDKVNGCHYEQYVADPNKAVLTADNVTIKVQGTSSAFYGVAAYNIDSEFKNGFVDADGNQIEGWAMSENSIPVNYFCTKVNVASSENANNAINADVYNELQPYHDAHRQRNPKARDCLEFHPGVMFVRDNNKTTGSATYADNNVFYDTSGYISNPYYKQYAICNMGNSKKNLEVFHDTQNEKCCCIEVLDNQQAQQQMTSDEGVEPNCFDNGSDWYEFRYPDGNEEATEEMKQAWCDFVKWMVKWNPATATNEPLEEPYTGKSYTFGSKEGAVYSTGSSASLKGFTETTFDGVKFDNDTKEYRVAKMLEECEDHLVMDSVVFHYLFIERHTMVDNVAKNTFWSTEDLKHWDLTKNYDNDTSDGNDNSGMLTFSYGIECMDPRPGSAGEDSAKAFNAADSAWLNFIDGLTLTRQRMYEQLTANADSPWRAANYLSRMQNFQDVIPERCWIEDYFRKYLRPRRIGQDSGGTYISRLEGGKKTHQRAQYENYQEFYLDSKYRAGTARNSYINIRAQKTPDSEQSNMTEDQRHLDVSMYIDSYFWASIGQQESGGAAGEKFARLKRGEKLSVEIPNVDTLNDATTYLYGAKYLQTLQRSAILFPETYDAGAAMKLRTLDLGSIDGKFKNPYLRSLTLPSSYLLESLNAQNVKGPVQEGQVSNTAFQNLELQSYSSLKDINISGSSVRSVSFAPGGLLETAKLSALRSLTMIRLSKLTDVTFDEGIEKSLETLHIEDCPEVINTQELVTKVNKTGRFFSGYRLINVNWTITENDLNDGKLETIDILEKFVPNSEFDPQQGWYKDKNRPLGYDVSTQNTQATPGTCLTGTLTIDLECEIDEYTLYYKYQTNFPNLEIKYSNKVTLTKAPTITFMENDLDDSPILKQVKTDGKTPIETLISAEGPSGIPMGEPHKPSDNLYNYYWNVAGVESGRDDNDWKDKDTNQEYTDSAMKQLVPTKDTVFVPIFTSMARSYTIEYRDNDGVTVLNDYFNNGSYTYGAQAHLLLYYYKPHARPTEKKWTLRGWMNYQEFSKWNVNHNYSPALIMNENNFSVTQDTILYAYFIEEDINTPTRADLFKATPVNVSVTNNDGSTYSNTQIVDGQGRRITTYKIDLDEENKGSYREFFKDVLVLPKSFITYNDGQPTDNYYYVVGDFSRMPYVPKIMFEEGCKYLELTPLTGDSSAIGSFANAILRPGSTEDRQMAVSYVEHPALTEIVLPPSLKKIGNGAFIYQHDLININWENVTEIGSQAFYQTESLQKNGLPSKLYNIGYRAFYESSADLIIEELPPTVRLLNATVFAYCGNGKGYNNINLKRLGSAQEGAQTLDVNGVLIFADGGKTPELTEFWVEKNVNPKVAKNCLQNFGPNITKVHFAKSEQEYKTACPDIGDQTVSAYMGLAHVQEEDFLEQ